MASRTRGRSLSQVLGGLKGGATVPSLVTDTSWLGPSLWAILYVSDYFFTITCARMYRAQDKIVFEGSYEITPMFQADVNALRLISPRFLLILLASTAYLAFLQHVSTQSPELRGAYCFVLGALLLVEATVHVRHLRNWFLFRHGLRQHGVRGRIEYPRLLILRTSAFEILVFAGMYAGLFLLTGVPFILGGAIGCFVLSMNHYRLARRHKAAQPPAA